MKPQREPALTTTGATNAHTVHHAWAPLKIIGLSLLAGVIVGMGLLARPLVDRLVESVAATDQETETPA
jgi:hypothetical protein